MDEKPPSLVEAVWAEVAKVEDPEIGLALTELGLIYGIDVDADAKATIQMTLTSMGCPAGEYLKSAVHAAATRVPGITDAHVDVVWQPPWNPREMASEDAKMMLGIV